MVGLIEGGVMPEIMMQNRAVTISLSRSAEKALEERHGPLFVEMELYFSCLIRKQVLFHEQQRQSDSVTVNDKLSVSFHPVMTSSCMIAEADAEPAKSDFDMVRRDCFTPKWLKLDYKKGRWTGEYGYRNN